MPRAPVFQIRGGAYSVIVLLSVVRLTNSSWLNASVSVPRCNDDEHLRIADDEDLSDIFSSEPMTTAECLSQFFAGCGPGWYTRSQCTDETILRTQALHLMCIGSESPAEDIFQTATVMASQPRGLKKGIVADFPGNVIIPPASISPVRLNIIKFSIWSCKSPTITSQFPSLAMSNMLALDMEFCKNLIIKRDDFQTNKNLRVIRLWTCTIATLEAHTFQNLPDLKLLAIEQGFSTYFSKEVNAYVMKLRCDAEYQWFRDWYTQEPAIFSRVDYCEAFNVSNVCSDGEKDYYQFKVISRSEVNCQNGTYHYDDVKGTFFDPVGHPGEVKIIN